MSHPLIVFHVQDTHGRPLDSALIQGASPEFGDWQGLTNPCGDFVATLSPGHYELTVSHLSAPSRTLPADLADCGVITIGLESVVPVLVPRSPLPPFDHDTTDPDTGAPLPVYTVLREPPPDRPNITWWRGDAWGVTLPGLPVVAGGANGAAQDRVLTYFLDR